MYLHVVGRREDGYHCLDSLIAFAAFGDRIEVRHADSLSLVVEGPFAKGLPTDDGNLVLRAARALAAEAGGQTPRGAAIRLVKNLPVASGIGGGSSDAAATLKALNRLWGLNAGPDTLNRVGFGIGADVPVCLAGHTALVSGAGEVVVAGPALPPLGVLLVNPGVQVPTAAVFRALAGRFSAPAPQPPGATDPGEFVDWLASLRNDLCAAAVMIAPQIETVLAAIRATTGCLLARLSGSGATCFGLFPTMNAAEAAARAITASHEDWWVVPTTFLLDSPTQRPR